MSETIAIVGAGHAGATLAVHLRELGFAGRLLLIGEEPHPPYQRPPLSKKYLNGEWPAERLYLRSEETWAAMAIELHREAPVTALDTRAKTLTIGKTRYGWDKLALTTGAASRPIPPEFAGHANVFDLRSIADVDALRAAYRPRSRMAIIGGGFIGLETAAVAAKNGIAVTVIERAGRLMERAVGPATSAAFKALHEGSGVRFHMETSVTRVERETDGTRLELSNGESVMADSMLVSIGVAPATALAEAGGIATGNGITVDEYGRTSAPDVWAAGDCTNFPLHGARHRLESVQNAVDQAKAVAADMLGHGQPYRPVPWFWSDQYDTKLQITGLYHGYTDVISRAGRAGLAHWYFRGEDFITVEAINEPASFMLGRKLLEGGIALPRASMTDPGFDPRSCLR